MNASLPAPAPLLEAWNVRNSDPELARATVDLYLDSPHHAEAQTLLAYLTWRQGQLQKAAELAFASLNELQQRPPSMWLGNAMNILGCLESHLNRPSEAMRLFDQQLKVAQEIGDYTLEAAALHDMGMCQMAGQPESALFYLEQAMEMFERSDDLFGVAVCHYNLSVIEYRAGKLAEAREHIERALQYPSLHNVPSLEGCLRGIYLNVLKELGADEHAQAQISALESLIEQQREDPILQLDYAMALAEYHKDQPLRVIGLLLPMLQNLEALGSHENFSHVHESLSQAYMALGQPSEALSHLQAVLDIERKFQASQVEEQARTLDVLHRVRLLQKAAEQERQRSAQLQAHVQELQRLNVRIQQLNRTDSLTGLTNRHYLFEVGEVLAQQATPEEPLAVALLDINQFKAVNDTHGHLVGDQVLTQVAALMKAATAPQDIVARYGGEEFVILRPNATADELAATCQELNQQVSHFDWTSTLPRSQIKITLSIGVAQTADNLEEAIGQADRRMYIAKLSGSANVQTQG